MAKKILVAMSGGVDSSVAALLLQKQGYAVAGLTMCLGIKREDGAACCGAQAIDDARRVCDKLGIAHYVLDFSQALKDKVIDPFIADYLAGRTPNPCANCNTHLKFDLLFKKARALGFEYFATGHYADVVRSGRAYFLKRAADAQKDQSYFLYGIKKEVLPFIKFPLAALTKPEVRALAQAAGLPVAQKKESQDICFVPDNDYTQLVKSCAAARPGEIVDLTGRVLGKHKGVIFYTIGQRQGLGIGGGKPFYVTVLDAAHNRIVVGSKADLFASGLVADEINLFRNSLPSKLMCQIRYRSPAVPCRAKIVKDRLEVTFGSLQAAVTPGQVAALYHRDRLVAGGVIRAARL